MPKQKRNRKNRIERLVILALVFFSVDSLADKQADEIKAALEQVGKRVESFTNDFQKLKAGPQCIDVKPDSYCGFASQCELFRSKSNDLKLTESKDGRFIPNYSLVDFVEGARGCSVYGLGLMKVMESIDPDKKDESKLKEAKFLKVISDNNDEKSYIIMQQAILTDAYSKKDGLFNTIYDHDQAVKYIETYEKRVGVHLSKQSREAWVVEMTDKLPTYQRLANDPFLYPTLLQTQFEGNSIAQGQELQKLYGKRMSEAKDLVSTAQAQIVEVLESYENKENADQIDNLIDRITTVRFDMKATDSCDSANASYSPGTHSFNLCPQVLNLPKESLKMIIAHELGHSIDPCTASFPLRLVFGNVKPKKNYGHDAREIPMLIKDIVSDEVPMTALDDSLARESYGSKFENIKFADESPAINFDSNPFVKNGVVKCLGGEMSLGAKIPDLDSTKRNLDKSIQNLKSAGVKEDDEVMISKRKTRANLETYWKNKRACGFIPHEPSQMQEAFADFISSKVISKDVEKATSADEKKKIASEVTGFFLGNSCLMNRSQFQQDMKKDFKNKVNCFNDTPSDSFGEDLQNMDAAHQEDAEEHPAASRRMDAIFLSDPQVSSALNCGHQTSRYKSCE